MFYVPASSAAALAQVTGREVRVYCPRNTAEMLYAASQTRMHPQRPSAHAPVMISWVPRGWPGFTYDAKTGQMSTTIQSNNHFVPIAIGPGFGGAQLGCFDGSLSTDSKATRSSSPGFVLGEPTVVLSQQTMQVV